MSWIYGTTLNSTRRQKKKLINLNWRSWLPGKTEASSADKEERIRAAVVRNFMAQLTIAPVRKTQLVKISFESKDRQLAAEVVNTVARVYIRSQLEAKLLSTQAAGDWLSSRLVDLKSNLEVSEQALQEYRDLEQLLDAAGVKTLSSQELNELTTRLGEARRARIETENIYKELGSTQPQPGTHPC